MTIQLKPNLVATLLTIFSLFFLYCSTAYAEKRTKQKLHSNLTKDIVVFTIQSSAIDDINNFSYPTITSEIFTQYHQSNAVSANQHSQQPMQGIKVADFSSLVPRKFDKKNSFFEFAAKFNDKLQQVIAYFNFSSKSAKSKENINEKVDKRKVNFIVKNIN